jgi:chromosome segregation ATPase
MRTLVLITGLALGTAALLAVATTDGSAQAQSETDRLRDALRSSTAQVRALEDQRATSQAKLTEMTRARDALKIEAEAAKAQAKKVEADYRTAVKEFNERLEERNQTLEKWKDAYAEAATVARTKDGERAKFETDWKTAKAATKACVVKNQELVRAGRDLLGHIQGITLGDVALGSEPFTGLRRVEIQNLLQDYGDKILNQKVMP